MWFLKRKNQKSVNTDSYKIIGYSIQGKIIILKFQLSVAFRLMGFLVPPITALFIETNENNMLSHHYRRERRKKQTVNCGGSQGINESLETSGPDQWPNLIKCNTSR